MTKRLKLLLVMLVLGLYCNTTNAQDIQRFEFDSHELSVGYGFGSAVKQLNKFSDEALDAYDFDSGDNWGSLNLNYLYRFSDKVTVGLAYSYTGVKRLYTQHNAQVAEGKIDIHIIMPQFKSNWYKSDYITLYSRAALGFLVGFVDNKDILEEKDFTKFDFAFQLSPIGIEVGKQFALYLEAGYGYQGVLQAGFRYRF